MRMSPSYWKTVPELLTVIMDCTGPPFIVVTPETRKLLAAEPKVIPPLDAVPPTVSVLTVTLAISTCGPPMAML